MIKTDKRLSKWKISADNLDSHGSLNLATLICFNFKRNMNLIKYQRLRHTITSLFHQYDFQYNEHYRKFRFGARLRVTFAAAENSSQSPN